MFGSKLRLLSTVALVGIVGAACGDDPMTSGTASVSLALTDAPGDVDSVWVAIDEIYLQGDGDDGRVSLLAGEDAEALGLIELTQLSGSTLDLVSDVEIPAGNYGQLRFVIAGAVLQTEGGEVYTFNAEHPYDEPATGTLICPSCAQSGIKVLLPGDVAQLDAGTHLIVLDFDVSQSFGHVAGMSGNWVMHPVIRGAELGFTGAVTGTVDVERDVDELPLVEIPECPAGEPRDLTSFLPVAVAETLVDDEENPVAATTTVDEDGTFAFPFLSPDEYDFTYEGQIVFGDDTLTFEADAPGILDVTTGADLVVEYTITSATCTEVS